MLKFLLQMIVETSVTSLYQKESHKNVAGLHNNNYNNHSSTIIIPNTIAYHTYNNITTHNYNNKTIRINIK